MMVTFISQCEKKALNRTRRVLDAFADRIGDNTWQTVITQEGLLAVKKLLRKTATKNTAVSCHWLRSRSRTELVWVVGNKRKFDSEGRVPVNTTQRQSASDADENRWQHAHSIQILAVLAALLHDLGKATIGFQKKLFRKGKNVADPYRHEWISLRLFQAMIYGCEDDQSWLDRLVDFSAYRQSNPNWLDKLINDATDRKNKHARLNALPNLAKLVCWLIVTHHRLPTYGIEYFKERVRKDERNNPRNWGIDIGIEEFYSNLEPFENWVKNQNQENVQDFWHLKSDVMASKIWQSAVARWARKARDHGPLRELASRPISDPFLMHMSRLCLMLADHKYSSLLSDDKDRVEGDAVFRDNLFANTDFGKAPVVGKQALDEHLLGVGEYAKRVANEIPRLLEKLSGLPEKHRPFIEPTRNDLYAWQNGAFTLAKQLQPKAQEQGFFGINMASTGRGKTLGNARIMYALGNPETGPRFTIALGLRVLTLQTGRALRERLKLNDELLAVLVGGAANRKLFELNEGATDKTKAEDFGSESLEALLDYNDVVDSSILPDEFNTLLSDPKAGSLICAPVVTCTVDHIMQASENSRGGRHIAPILRLLTSDLVLDEPDDFDQSDLPALARLIYFAGLFGSKVLLSSATLTPDFSEGLYKAYAAGRAIWNRHMGINPALPVCCAWFDEYDQVQQTCANGTEFSAVHQRFSAQRSQKLQSQPPRRKAAILPAELTPSARENERVNMAALADLVLTSALQLHSDHAETCPLTGKRASIGLLRMANVQQIVQMVQALSRQHPMQADVQIHLCCYHAKQLLVLRSALEQKLDRILARHQPNAIFAQPEIRHVLDSSAASQHLFLVVASPVAEVGRDHDYDWAIVEPSSMRSIIQLAGRVWRHRPDKIAEKPNVLVLDRNIRGLRGDELAFMRPGFEQAKQFKLSTHFCHDLVAQAELDRVDAVPRVIRAEVLQPSTRLADLEHAVMADLLNNPASFVSAFWRANNGNHPSAHLQKISPFRNNDYPQDDYVCLPVNDACTEFKFTYAEAAWEDLEHCEFQTNKIRFAEFQTDNGWVTPWLSEELSEALLNLSQQLVEDNLAKVARQYAQVRLERTETQWQFHPWFGFWKTRDTA